MPAALAIELVHTFSLVHDDLPAMDDDEERRGHPSTWKKFGEGVGVLAGDALLAEAFRLAARYESSAVARELAEATLGMIGGQYLDTMVEGYDLAAVHRLKTGRLFYASVTLALWAAELPLDRAGAVARLRGGARAAVPDRRRHPRRGRLRPRARRRRCAALRRRGSGAGARAARGDRRGHVRPARHRRRARRPHGVTLPSGEQFELAAGSQRVVVVEVGGGIREWDGVLLGYGSDEMCSSGRGQVLAPWPNRLAGGQYEWEGARAPAARERGGERQLDPRSRPLGELARRGARCGARGARARASPAAGISALPCACASSTGWRKPALTVQTEAENVGDGACPFGVGHHPYVLAPTGRVDDLLLDGEPIGERRLDETRHDPGGWRVEVGEVAIWADESWPWRQVFTGDLPDIRRRGLADRADDAVRRRRSAPART